MNFRNKPLQPRIRRAGARSFRREEMARRPVTVRPEPQETRDYTHCQKFFPPPLTLTLSPRWGERG